MGLTLAVLGRTFMLRITWLLGALCAAMVVNLARAGGEPEAVNVSASEALSMSPRLAAVPGGGAAVVWREGDINGAQIFLAHNAGGGASWTTGRDISDTPGPAYL